MISKFFNQKRKKNMQGPSAAVLRYDPDQDASPMVVAHGKGHIAAQIIEMARQHNIPLQEEPMLVENLIDMDLGDNIPPQLYMVIAEVLLMIEEIERNM